LQPLKPKLLWLVAAAAIVAAGAAAAVVALREDEPAPRVLVEEQRGVLRGVHFGDSSAEVRRRLGEPTDDEPGVFPADAKYTGPPSIPAPPSDQGAGASETLHYEDTAYLVSAAAGEGAFGGTPKYPWCRALGDVHVFFGEDPIESITMSSTAARG